MSCTRALFGLLVLVGCTAATLPAGAQHFKLMSGTLTQIAVGRSEVWGLNGSEIYRFNTSSEKFKQVKGYLAQVAVGGGSLLQQDEVWGINASGDVYRFNYGKNEFQQVSGNLTQIAVGVGNADTINPDNCHAYEVWGISELSITLPGNLWRYNFCTSQFENIANPNGPATAVTQIAVGTNNIWALDETTYPSEYTNGKWYHPSPNSALQTISAGVDESVWGVSVPSGNGTSALRYSPTKWSFDEVCVGDCQSGGAPTPLQIAAGGEGTWLVYFDAPNVEVARYTNLRSPDFGLENPLFQGPVFSLFGGTGSVVQVAVGSGGGVWMITKQLQAGLGEKYQVWTFVRP